MSSVWLTRDQITKLYEMMRHFKEVESFKVTATSNNGIGYAVTASFEVLDVTAKVDITEYDKW